MMFARKLVSSLSLALCLAGCSKGEQPPSPPDTSKAGAASSAPAGEKVLNLYTWADYFLPEVLEEFTKTTGIRVRVDTYDSNEAMSTKLGAGAGGYDIVLPSDYTVTILSRSGKLQALDHSKLPNLKNLDEQFTNPAYDPGMKFSVPFLWGTSGIGYLSDKVTEPVESWSFLLQPSDALKGKISMLKDSRECFGAALKFKGYSVNATAEAEIMAAKEVLAKQAPAVKVLTSDTYKDGLAQGEFLASHGWSTTVAMARYKGNPAIRYVIPKEGAIIYMDTMAIPVGAQNLENAYTFLNYFLEGKAAAKVASETFGSTPNKAAREFIKPEILADQSLYPPPEVMKRLEYLSDVGEATRTYDTAWTELRAQ